MAAKIPHESPVLTESIMTISSGYSTLISDEHADEAKRLR